MKGGLASVVRFLCRGKLQGSKLQVEKRKMGGLGLRSRCECDGRRSREGKVECETRDSTKWSKWDEKGGGTEFLYSQMLKPHTHTFSIQSRRVTVGSRPYL
jgi:hypothetical protein